METLFVVLSLNVRRGSSEEIWPLGGFLKVLLPLTGLHPDKILLFLRCQKCQSVSKIMKIKVAKINVTLTVFIPLNAVLAFPMRRLFKGSVYSRAAFIWKSLFFLQ